MFVNIGILAALAQEEVLFAIFSEAKVGNFLAMALANSESH
jgi:hypothetical protein